MREITTELPTNRVDIASKISQLGTNGVKTNQRLASENPTERKTYRKSNRYCGVCECGDHAWAVLTKGYVTLVSPEDAHLLQVGKWSANVWRRRLVYVQRYRARGLIYLLHREILGNPAGYVDHKNHNGLDNRRPNLRPCSQSQNNGNARISLSKSGFRGVSKGSLLRWRATLNKRSLGYFKTAEDAARAYDAASVAYYGEFATLNFPD